MPGAKERTLRGRIKSVQATQKITKAMELIAASRIVKAQQRVLAARPYSEKITEVIHNVASSGAEAKHPLLVGHGRDRKVAFVVVSADRGLAGGYNTNVIRLAERSIISERSDGKDIALITVGRKAESYFRYRHYNIDATFSGFTEQPTYDNAKEVAAYLLEHFIAGEYDRIELVYTQFLSAGSQLPIMRRLAPMEIETLAIATGIAQAGYEFEPAPTSILELLLPRYLESRLYAAFLDAAASEHAARQRAMKAATDNAKELIKRYTRIMNQARQDAITTEIMEIVGGAEALRQAGNDSEDLILDSVIVEDLLIGHNA